MFDQTSLEQAPGGILRAAWADLGTFGRALLAGGAAMALAMLLLAQTVPARVEQAIVDSELHAVGDVAVRLERSGMLPFDPSDPAEVAALDDFIGASVHGHDVVRVKLWSTDRTVLYSDLESFIGERSPAEPALGAALAGRMVAVRPDLSSTESQTDDTLPSAWELYVPIVTESGAVIGALEVYHLSEPFDETVGSVRRYVTMTSGAGVLLGAVLLLALMIGRGRRAVDQQRKAETMFGNLVRARAEERARIVGALHDDIGQPLYRIHYELQSLLGRTDDGIAERVQAVDEMVLAVDGALRSELKTLRHGTAEELRLDTALYELVELTETETDMAIRLYVDPAGTGQGSGWIALFRAAQEALMNVRKHAGAGTATISVRRMWNGVALAVADDGNGNRGDEGIGLAVTRERIEALGGTLKVKARPGRGTTVTAWLPAAACEDPE
jgi:signal transduction histidine kinase